ncbi:probable serine/threonine-protein kinase WNK9 isoform X2 [Cornus florida]|uniref:probable serine/threonine-protein kinase WNK9 isoform X2 n=1 Tax=Cornus florida TaxID=4283 RepID=UPI0028A25B49|nr:probable serine/threonine-protein kinase WNK9 isoform X2 [Cornus florida]
MVLLSWNQIPLNLLKLIQLEDMEGYRAFDEYEGIEVAWNQVKLYDFLESPEDLERLYCEIHLLKTLKHINIMKFYTSWVDTANRNINFVTEMFTSGTLRQYRLKHKRVNIRAIKNWCRQILTGLHYLHSHDPPIIHRDLKCDNIFVNGNQGEVKIGDLGLAAILRKSHAARCVGTPEFMAPEVYAEEYNELVDIYSFGMCILEMVTFEYPYSECTHPAQIYKKVISGRKPEALYKVEDLEVRQFVDKCLATVSHRLTAKELLRDPFLQIDDYSSDLTRIKYCRDFDEVGPLFRQPLLINRHNGSSLVNGCSNYLGYRTENDLDYHPVEFRTKEIDLFTNQEDEHLAHIDITIKGRRKEDDGIFLRLRIGDKEGRVRNIYFPFDTESDTAFSVATEMVAELDIIDQDVTKIADMIDGEIASLVPEWKRGLGRDESSHYTSEKLCHNCNSNGAFVDYMSSNNQGSKDLQIIQCSNHGCAAVHGRFEEITYQFEGSEQCDTEGAPVVSSQSDGIHYADIWAQHDGPELSSDGYSRDFHSGDEQESFDKSTLRKVECVTNMDNEKRSNVRASPSVDPSVARALAEDYENEIRQELRWLKAKYQIQLGELRDQQLGVPSKSSSSTVVFNNKKYRKDSSFRLSSVSTPSEEENSELLLKSFASGKHLTSYFPVNGEKKCVNQTIRDYESTYGSCSPEQMITAKSYYSGALLPHTLQRATSLPVDSIDF